MSIFTCVINVIEVLSNSKRQLNIFSYIYAIVNDSSKRICDKFYQLKVKAIMLIPLKLVMFGIYLNGLFSVFGNESFVVLYFTFFMFLRVIQFYMVVDVVRMKLEILNEDLLDLLKTEKSKPVMDLKVIRVRMEKIRSDYVYLKDMSVILNDAFAWSIFFLVLLFTTFLICCTYWFLLSLLKDVVTLKPYESICYILVTFMILAFTNQPCAQCLNLVNFYFI